jgi:hypothetical protein
MLVVAAITKPSQARAEISLLVYRRPSITGDSFSASYTPK